MPFPPAPMPSQPTGAPQPGPGALPQGISPQMLLMLLMRLLSPQLAQGQPAPMAPASPAAPPSGPQGAPDGAPLLEALRNLQRMAAARSLQSMAGGPPQR